MPERALLLGPVKTLAQEYPSLRCVNVDLPWPVDGALVGRLIAETTAEPTRPVVAYRGGSRWVQDYEAVRLEPPAPEGVRLRERGVYLITGGLGGLGLTFAELPGARIPGPSGAARRLGAPRPRRLGRVAVDPWRGGPHQPAHPQDPGDRGLRRRGAGGRRRRRRPGADARHGRPGRRALRRDPRGDPRRRPGRRRHGPAQDRGSGQPRAGPQGGGDPRAAGRPGRHASRLRRPLLVDDRRGGRPRPGRLRRRQQLPRRPRPRPVAGRRAADGVDQLGGLGGGRHGGGGGPHPRRFPRRAGTGGEDRGHPSAARPLRLRDGGPDDLRDRPQHRPALGGAGAQGPGGPHGSRHHLPRAGAGRLPASRRPVRGVCAGRRGRAAGRLLPLAAAAAGGEAADARLPGEGRRRLQLPGGEPHRDRPRRARLAAARPRPGAGAGRAARPWRATTSPGSSPAAPSARWRSRGR